MARATTPGTVVVEWPSNWDRDNASLTYTVYQDGIAVGTVTDPLPAPLTCNVHRLDNPQEPVLGFVGAHTVVQRRLFATPTSLGLPQGWQFEDPDADCSSGIELVPDPNDKHPIYLPDTRLFKSGDNVPTEYYIEKGDTLGYIGASKSCVDCRTRGTTTKPSFW